MPRHLCSRVACKTSSRKHLLSQWCTLRQICPRHFPCAQCGSPVCTTLACAPWRWTGCSSLLHARLCMRCPAGNVLCRQTGVPKSAFTAARAALQTALPGRQQGGGRDKLACTTAHPVLGRHRAGRHLWAAGAVRGGAPAGAQACGTGDGARRPAHATSPASGCALHPASTGAGVCRLAGAAVL